VTSSAGRSSIGIFEPSGNLRVEGGERRGDVERHAVPPREHGERIGADLVRHVAVGGDAVGPHDHEVDFAASHQVAGHVVRDERAGDAFLHAFPGREACALQVGARLARDDRNPLLLLESGP
jgi:hypothetical protein